MKDIRIAAVVMNAPVGRIRRNLNHTTQWAVRAKKEGAALVCFPEMNITGYDAKPEIKDSAEPIPGPVTRVLLELAEREDIVILAGLAEKDESENIFASHLVVQPGGKLGVYRKLHIAPPEHGIYSPAKEIPLFSALGITLGVQLCYDAHFPELSSHMALNGAEIIFMPHASPRGTPEEKLDSWRRHLPARAYDNSLFVVACNQTGDNASGLSFPGVALILGPSGETLDKKVNDQEGMLVVDLKAGDLARVRNHRMRYFLPSKRLDLFDFKIK
ncbi:MAG: nitrilase-related carbon-nitrogen hydrolase [Desulfobacterales bacterium]|jgi:N-carbamoylputrescine amidase